MSRHDLVLGGWSSPCFTDTQTGTEMLSCARHVSPVLAEGVCGPSARGLCSSHWPGHPPPGASREDPGTPRAEWVCSSPGALSLVGTRGCGVATTCLPQGWGWAGTTLHSPAPQLPMTTAIL